MFGVEYYTPLEKAATHLLRLGEQHGYAWTPTAVYSAWEELWSRFCEEARERDRRVVLVCQGLGNGRARSEPGPDQHTKRHPNGTASTTAAPGLKGSKARTHEEVEKEFTRIRAEQASKAAAAKQEGIAQAAKAKASAKSRRRLAELDSGAACRRTKTPAPQASTRWRTSMNGINPTDQEETVGALLESRGRPGGLTRSSSPFAATPRAEQMRQVDAEEARLRLPPSTHLPWSTSPCCSRKLPFEGA